MIYTEVASGGAVLSGCACIPPIRLEDAIYSFLTSQASISCLVEERIYPVHLPQSATFPAITFTIISSPHEHNLAGLSIKRARVQFDCWSYNLGTSVDIAQVLFDLFDTFNGYMKGIDVVRAAVENEFDFAEAPDDGSDNWLYRKTADYIFRYR